MTTTTIKVPVELRDRLAELAKRDGTTLAGAIVRSLDAAEESAFWAAVAKTLGASPATEEADVDGQQHVSAGAEALSGDLSDGLDPDETWDDVW